MIHNRTLWKAAQTLVLSASVILFASITVKAQTIQEQIDAAVQREMTAQNIPGLALAIVKNGTIAFSKGYGLADRERNIAMTPATRFQIASTSKAVTAVAVMQLVEEGRIALADDINKFLPFPVRNPMFADRPITVEMVLAHTSSINDGPTLFNLVVPGDSPISLADLISRSLQPTGNLYDQAATFATRAPGTEFRYTNMNTALLGYIVERVAGRPFNVQCNERIFTPLCMNASRWFLSELDSSNVARPYRKSGMTLTPRPHTGFPDYPDGQLRSTVLDLSKFLWAFINGGVPFAGARMLRSETISTMTRVRFAGSEMGLHLFSDDLDGTITWGHGGSLEDAGSDLQFSVGDSIGVSILANTDVRITSLRNAIMRLARELPVNPRNPVQCILATSVRSQASIDAASIEISPNPTADVLRVNCSEKNVSVRLVDVLGNIVFQQENVSTPLHISLAELVQGSYYLVISREGSVVATKYVVKM